MAVHFLVGWLGLSGSARGGGAEGQSPPGASGISWRAGGCRTRPQLSALAAAPPPFPDAGRPGGGDNVAGLVAGRRPSSLLKWVPPGCSLEGRWGDRGGAGRNGGQQWPAEPALFQAARIPPFFQASGTGSQVWGPGTCFQPQGFSR